MHDLYKNINDYNPDKENKILIVFDDMIADMINNKKLLKKFQKMLGYILLTSLLQKFQIKENFNKLQ